MNMQARAAFHSPALDYNAINTVIDGYIKRIAQLNGVGTASRQFNVTPAISEKLIKAIQEQSNFLKAINIVPVTQQVGRAISIGAKTLIGGRTDVTAGHVRQPKPVHSLHPDDYECVLTEFDTAITYDDIDQWRHMPNFQQIISAAIVESIALTRIATGWNGISAAVHTNSAANPLMEDVNKGWIQKLREGRSAGVMSEVVAASGKVIVGGASADYKNMDALVYDGRQLLHPNYRDRNDLVAFCSDNLLHDKYFNLLNSAGQVATEVNAASMHLSTEMIGKTRAAKVPFFPSGSVVITPMSNLSIYIQQGTQRRHIKDMPEIKAVNDFQSLNEAYVVQDLEAMAVIENIELAS